MGATLVASGGSQPFSPHLLLGRITIVMAAPLGSVCGSDNPSGSTGFPGVDEQCRRSAKRGTDAEKGGEALWARWVQEDKFWQNTLCFELGLRSREATLKSSAVEVSETPTFCVATRCCQSGISYNARNV